MLSFEKFPFLEDQNQQLIWDSRQEAKDGQAALCLVLRSGAKVEHLDLLLQKYSIEKYSTEKYPNVFRVVSSKKNQQFLGERGLLDKVTWVEDADCWLAERACSFYKNPSSELRLIGVTGTNGKSSCVDFLAKAAAASGKKSMLVGTLGIEVFSEQGELLQTLQTGFTTPEAPSLQKLLRDAVQEKVEVVAMEVSSHALALGRVHGCEFKDAVLTNITQDHLDFHGTMKNYAHAKGQLFRKYLKGRGIVYLGDDYCRNLFDEFQNLNSSVCWTGVPVLAQGEVFHREGWLHFTWREDSFSVPLRGTFHAANIRLCLEVVGDLFSSPKDIQQFLEHYKGAPGRMQEVSKGVFVDYAHTPAALESSLQSLRQSMAPGAHLSVVFGCGGDRDRSKRSLMGKVAMENADVVFVTNDNPRSEDPQAIVAEILADKALSKNLRERARLFVELDREKAIALALSKKSEEGCVLIAGKGHEEYQIVGDKRFPFSDKDVVLKLQK